MNYRERPDAQAPEAPPRAEVDDAVRQMVRQFADRFAFLRELVQNALDAGATEVHVTLEDVGGALEVGVDDDGCGMDQATVERCLLVLFRSSKDGDATKIGRFGVGFFSVFAPKPGWVTVDTGTRPDAPSLRLLLRPDFSWELTEAPPRRGTLVRVHLHGAPDELAPRCEDALARWCPHVRVPLWCERIGGPSPSAPRRLDVPFGLDGPAAIARDTRDGARFALCLSEAPATRVFNRGILLLESRELVAPDVSLALDAPDLHHTLSRDDVLRDDAWQRRWRHAQALARDDLHDQVVRAFNRASLAVAREIQGEPADEGARDALAALARVLGRGERNFAADALRFPLWHAVGEGDARRVVAGLERGWFRARELRFARRADPLTAALARAQVPVVALGALGDAARTDDLARLFARVTGELGRDAAASDLALQRWPDARLGPGDRALRDLVARLAAPLDIPEVTLVDAHGARADALAYGLDADLARRDEALLLAPTAAALKPRPGRALALRGAHPTWTASAQIPRASLPLAALSLLRVTLLQADALDRAADRALWRAAAEALA